MKKFLIITALVASLLGFASTASAAFEPLGKACTTNGGQSAACNPTSGNQDPITGPNGVLGKVTKLVANIAGIAALIMIVVAGLFYVTSDGDAQKIKSAKSALIGALIGLAIVATAQAILTFVIQKV